MIIPFGLWPQHWSLRGKARLRKEAEYYLDGEDLDRRLVEIDYNDVTSVDSSLATLEIDRKYKKISDYDYHKKKIILTTIDKNEQTARLLSLDHQFGKISDYDFKVAKIKLEFGEDSNSCKLALLDLDLAEKKIDKHEHDKASATIQDKPYVGVIGTDYNHKLGVNGLFMELDWNDQFVQVLIENGYKGDSDEIIVNKWFDHVCRSIAEEEEVEPIDAFVTTASHVRRIRHEDGKTEIG